MNKITFIIACLICCPTLLWATPRTVTIIWTMADTAGVQNYEVYYADNYAMTNKSNHTDCSSVTENAPNTFSITCNNVDLTDNQTYYFTIVALMTDGNKLTSSPKDKSYTTSPLIEITPVQNFRAVITEP